MLNGSEIGQPAPYGHDREPVVFAGRDASTHTHSSDVEIVTEDASASAQAEPYAPELREPVRDIAASGEDSVTSDEAVAGSAVELEDSGRALDALYNAIVANQRRASGARLAVVQLGDSHTESDEFTGRLRRRFAQQFGSAGRGFVPVAGAQRDVVRTVSGPWTIERAPLRNASGAYGLGLARAIASNSSAVLTVGSCARCTQGPVSRFELYFQRSERAGSIEYRVDNGAWQRASTALAAGQSAADRLSVPVPEGVHSISVRPAGDGRVVLFGVAMERDTVGGSLESAGTIGALASHLDSADWSVLSTQLTARDPSLVLLWFGTNESANSHLDPARFEQALASIVGKVKRAAPHASVLIIGPPDLALRTASGERASPAQLARMVQAARSAAQSSGAAFYDLLSAMGGAGTIARWVTQEPRLAWGDHVHYTPRGYTALADTLFDALVRGYDRWARSANSALSRGARSAR